MTLITLETDGFKMEDEYLQSSLLKHWFTWNKPYEHVKLSALPIGLNHDRHVDMLQNFLNKKLAHFRTCRQFELHTEDSVILETDGENIGTPPLKYTILPKALQVII